MTLNWCERIISTWAKGDFDHVAQEWLEAARLDRCGLHEFNNGGMVYDGKQAYRMAIWNFGCTSAILGQIICIHVYCYSDQILFR